jgi:hypothetical protein
MKGVQLKQANEVRLFAHDVLDLNKSGSSYTYGDVIPGTDQRGVCLYAGVAIAEIEVVMESGTQCKFKGITAGSFLPVLVTKVIAIPDGATVGGEGELLALY